MYHVPRARRNRAFGGGGGAGLGGALFVQQGGNLTLAGPLTVNGNTVTAGAGGSGGGGSGGGNGSAFGSGLFLQGNDANNGGTAPREAGASRRAARAR